MPERQHSAPAVAQLDDRCRRFLERAESIRERHVVAAVVDLGKAALEELYEGSWERASGRGAAHEEPLAALVERHAERMEWIGLSVEQVRTALRAYRVNQQLPESSKGKLLVGSLRALAAIPDPEAMVRLANRAAEEQWSTRQTIDAVASWRERAGVRSKGGRPRLPAAVKAVRRLDKYANELAEVDVGELDDRRRDEVRASLEALRARVAVLLEALGE